MHIWKWMNSMRSSCASLRPSVSFSLRPCSFSLSNKPVWFKFEGMILKEPGTPRFLFHSKIFRPPPFIKYWFYRTDTHGFHFCFSLDIFSPPPPSTSFLRKCCMLLCKLEVIQGNSNSNFRWLYSLLKLVAPKVTSPMILEAFDFSH